MQRRIKYIVGLPGLLLFVQLFISCKKWIEVPPSPRNLTVEAAFGTDNEATSVMNSAYSLMINDENSFSSSSTTVFCGLSADEFIQPSQTSVDRVQFETNSLTSSNAILNNSFWTRAYSAIYRANVVLEGLENNNSVTDSVKSELIGEAKFLRAFCNFYLVNLFGPIPLVTSTDWRSNGKLSRTNTNAVYESMILDLKEAITRLPANYKAGGGEKIIPNKFAATALLARVYLYNKDWQQAESASTEVIGNPVLRLVNLSEVFNKNSDEAIWQLKQNNTFYPFNNTTPEGYALIPPLRNGPYAPIIAISQTLLTAFDSADNRKKNWMDSTLYTSSNTLYYFPFKYKTGIPQAVTSGPYTEYYMVLRLAEQYLIRAEARLMQNKPIDAIDDLNIIRNRAGLEELDSQIPSNEIVKALVKERQRELFAEWGHRWFDLKRWSMADAVLGPLKKSNWQPTDVLYPIPFTELVNAPNIEQNEGY